MLVFTLTTFWGRTHVLRGATIADALAAHYGVPIVDGFDNGDDERGFGIIVVEDGDDIDIYNTEGDIIGKVVEGGIAEVDDDEYRAALAAAQAAHPVIADATTPAADMPPNGRRFLAFGASGEVLGGYGIAWEDTLIGLWGRGIGGMLITHAIKHGARRLDCFDGRLVMIYAEHGFKIERRVRNWSEGGPDVVYMRLY